MLSPLRPGCALTVIIPAKDEERSLGGTLSAFANQRSLSGGPFNGDSFEVLVFANDCRDATAVVARAFAAKHPRLTMHVVEADLPSGAAHVGTARRAALGLAAQRFLQADKPRGIVATTDADTVVASDWIAWTVREMQQVDAVAGYVEVAADEIAKLGPSYRREYALERAYRRAVAEVHVRFDPQPTDPGPRHASFVGASFAVSAQAYQASGGVPPVSPLEDQAFERALLRIDATVRHSLRVRATTSSPARDAGRRWFRNLLPLPRDKPGARHAIHGRTSAPNVSPGSLEGRRAEALDRSANRP